MMNGKNCENLKFHIAETQHRIKNLNDSRKLRYCGILFYFFLAHKYFQGNYFY